jgi:putative tricarboxylic transport membrane protein
MMSPQLIRSLPYVVGLAVAAGLFVYLGHIDYTPRPGHLGPEAWPRAAAALMAAACLFEIVRLALSGKAVAENAADELEAPGEMSSGEPKFPLLLVGGIALVLLYAVVLPVLGFVLTTFLFLAAFIYLGRYRRHAVIWTFSATMTVLIAILFLRIAYVSLPRGIAPFDRIADLFLLIPGV